MADVLTWRLLCCSLLIGCSDPVGQAVDGGGWVDATADALPDSQIADGSLTDGTLGDFGPADALSDGAEDGRTPDGGSCSTVDDCPSMECHRVECDSSTCTYRRSFALCECQEETPAADEQCDDSDSQTLDRCVGTSCVHVPRSECTDVDGDHHLPVICGGLDCDDEDPLRNPDIAENCGNFVDDNCDGRRDSADPACGGSAQTTCEESVPLPASGMGSIHPDAPTHHYDLDIAEPSDVRVELRFTFGSGDDPPDFDYRVRILERCGDHASALLAMCIPASVPFAPKHQCYGGMIHGATSAGVYTRRLPPGNYTVEVFANSPEWFAADADAPTVDYSILSVVEPSAAAMCGDAPLLREGIPAVGTTATGSDAFAFSCNGSAVSLEESLHYFVLPERRRIRFSANADPSLTSFRGLLLGVHASCDPDGTRIACAESILRGGACPPRPSIEAVLEAGTYYISVEAFDHVGFVPLNIAYEALLQTEAVGEACADAIPIVAPGTFVGDTTGADDRFRDTRSCGSGYGPDAVYRVDLARRTELTLTSDASFASHLLVYSGCGETLLSRGSTTLSLDAGTYFVVLSGDSESDFGSYEVHVDF